MNILVNPMYSVDTINSDSNYIIIKHVATALSHHNFFVIIDSNRKYYKEKLADNIRLLYVPLERSKRRQVLNFQTQTIKKILDSYPITTIWNNVVEQGHNLKYFNTQMDKEWHYKVINYHHYNVHKSFGSTTYETMKNVLYQQIIGSLDVDVNYFHSKHSYSMFEEEASKILKADFMKEHINSHVELGGHIDKSYFKGAKKYDKYTFIYNHRLAGYKNYKKTFELFDKLYKHNPNFQVIATFADNSNMNTVKDREYLTIKSLKNYQAYINELQRCHANVTNSSHETFCIAIAESMQDNQLIIAPRAVTFPELLGDDYEFLFDSEEEQFEMMKRAVDEHITNIKHKNDLSIDRTAQTLDKLFKQYDYKKNALENIKDKSKKQKFLSIDKPTLTFKELTREVREAGLSLSQSVPTNKATKLFEDLGYRYNIKHDVFIKGV